jgi:hypothetical protein
MPAQPQWGRAAAGPHLNPVGGVPSPPGAPHGRRWRSWGRYGRRWRTNAGVAVPLLSSTWTLPTTSGEEREQPPKEGLFWRPVAAVAHWWGRVRRPGRSRGPTRGRPCSPPRSASRSRSSRSHGRHEAGGRPHRVLPRVRCLHLQIRRDEAKISIPYITVFLSIRDGKGEMLKLL